MEGSVNNDNDTVMEDVDEEDLSMGGFDGSNEQNKPADQQQQEVEEQQEPEQSEQTEAQNEQNDIQQMFEEGLVALETDMGINDAHVDLATRLRARFGKAYQGMKVEQTAWEDIIENKFFRHNRVFVADFETDALKSLEQIGRKLAAIFDALDSGVFRLFRRDLDKLVAETSDIKKALCFCLGPLPELYDKPAGQTDKDRRLAVNKHNTDQDRWCFQYAVFAMICSSIDRKQMAEDPDAVPVARTFQDPGFNLKTRYFIENFQNDTYDPIDRKEVVEVPKATELIDRDTFFYGIHPPSELWADIILGEKTPQLLLTNNIDEEQGGVGYRVATMFVEHAFLRNSDDAISSLVDRTAEFRESHREIKFHEIMQNPEEENIFYHTSFYILKKKADEENEPEDPANPPGEGAGGTGSEVNGSGVSWPGAFTAGGIGPGNNGAGGDGAGGNPGGTGSGGDQLEEDEHEEGETEAVKQPKSKKHKIEDSEDDDTPSKKPKHGTSPKPPKTPKKRLSQSGYKFKHKLPKSPPRTTPARACKKDVNYKDQL